MLVDSGLNRSERLGTEACLSRWPRVALTQTDIDNLIVN